MTFRKSENQVLWYALVALAVTVATVAYSLLHAVGNALPL